MLKLPEHLVLKFLEHLDFEIFILELSWMYLGVYYIQSHTVGFLLSAGDSSNSCIATYRIIEVGNN
jgi:hypothetical protein